MAIAAATLAVLSTPPLEAIELLESCEVTENSQVFVDRAKASAYWQLGRSDALSQLTDKYRDSIWHENFWFEKLLALAVQSNVQQIALALENAEEGYFKQTAHLVLANTAMKAGDHESTKWALDRLQPDAAERDVVSEFQIAWLRLFQKPSTTELRAIVNRCDAERQQCPPEYWLSIVQWAEAPAIVALCEQGQLLEAAERLRTRIGQDGKSPPTRLELFVSGRIAESCGLDQEARRLYEQLKPNQVWRPSLYELARLRLQAMEARETVTVD